MTMFFSSTYPSSRSRWRNASTRGETLDAEAPARIPTRGILAGCCASAIAPRASNTTATRIDGKPNLFIAHSVLHVTYHANGNKEKVIYGERSEGSLDPNLHEYRSMHGHASDFFRLTTFIFEKRPPRDVRRQISDVASDARKISLTGIVDKSRKWFTGLQIPQRFK